MSPVSSVVFETFLCKRKQNDLTLVHKQIVIVWESLMLGRSENTEILKYYKYTTHKFLFLQT